MCTVLHCWTQTRALNYPSLSILKQLSQVEPSQRPPHPTTLALAEGRPWHMERSATCSGHDTTNAAKSDTFAVGNQSCVKLTFHVPIFRQIYVGHQHGERILCVWQAFVYAFRLLSGFQSGQGLVFHTHTTPNVSYGKSGAAKYVAY